MTFDILKTKFNKYFLATMYMRSASRCLGSCLCKSRFFAWEKNLSEVKIKRKVVSPGLVVMG